MKPRHLLVSVALAACKGDAPAPSKPPSPSRSSTTGSNAPAGSATGGSAMPPSTLAPLATAGAATGTPRWGTSYGGLGSDAPRDAAALPDGGAVVVGLFEGNAGFANHGERKSAGGSDGWAAAVDGAGQTKWVVQVGAGRDDVASGVAVARGQVAIAGNFLDALALDSLRAKSRGSDDAYVAVVDAATGAPAWLWSAGGYDADGATDVAATPDGGWLVAAVFTASAIFGEVEVKSAGGTDAALVKLDGAGTVQWVKTFGGDYADAIHHVAVDGAGNLYAFGSFVDVASFGGEPLRAAGGSDTDVVLASYDATGGHRWSKRFGGQFNEVASGLAVDPAGNVYIAGAFTWGIDLGAGERKAVGEGDAFAASFAGDGTLRWDRTWGDRREDVAFGIGVDAAGQAVVVGRFLDTVDFGGGTGSRTAMGTNRDAFAVRLDAQGQTRWTQTFGARDHDEVRAVAVAPNGDVTLAGVYRFDVALGDVKLSSVRPPDDNTPMADTFVIRMAP